MKKIALTLALAFVFTVSFGCSNWNKMTPGPLDNRTIQAEIEKNFTADGLFGVAHSEVSDGTVTLTGNVKTDADRTKAYNDAVKVNGVKRVINNITVGK